MIRLGLFGGTFDPPHVGHLALAEWARERLSLDRVLFLPAGEPPHKPRHKISAGRDRLAMTRLAVRGHPGFEVSTLELERRGPSYTADTVRVLAADRRTRCYLLVGADNLDDFATWHESDVILANATLAVAGRPRSGAAGRRTWAARRGRVEWIGNPELDVSSSVVRARVKAGLSIRYLVPDAVAAYIARHRLYRAKRKAVARRLT